MPTFEPIWLGQTTDLSLGQTINLHALCCNILIKSLDLVLIFFGHVRLSLLYTRTKFICNDETKFWMWANQGSLFLKQSVAFIWSRGWTCLKGKWSANWPTVNVWGLIERDSKFKPASKADNFFHFILFFSPSFYQHTIFALKIKPLLWK